MAGDVGGDSRPSAGRAPVVLALAPHPDDEALGACGTLLELVGAGWRVVVLACSHGRPEQAERRRRELAEACDRAGFDVRDTRERIGISGSDDLDLAEELLVAEIADAVRELEPRLVVGPGPHDGHHGHEVVGRATHRALASIPADSRPRWWLWELWSSLPFPTLFVPVPSHVMEQAAQVLAAHAGELERNDYARALTARAELAAVLGRERVFGWGAAGAGDEHAEVLAEILCDLGEGWPLAASRSLDPNDPLGGAMPRGLDAETWLASVSARQQIRGQEPAGEDHRVRVVLDVSLLIRGSLSHQRYLREKYEFGYEISFSTETEPEVRVFGRAGADFVVVVSPQLLAEWDDVRRRPRWKGQLLGSQGEAIDEVLNDPSTVSVELGEIPRVCRDPRDDYLLATAVAGEAAFVASADKDLIDLGEHEGIRIVDAAGLLEALGR